MAPRARDHAAAVADKSRTTVIVTLTTMGYGDIMPIQPLARALAVLEALTGQLCIPILLARLVSLEIQSRRGG